MTGRRICSFTQTYSDARQELFTFHDRDAVDVYFRNKLDDNYFVFHNSSNDYIQAMQQKKYLQSIVTKQVIAINDVSYTQSLLQTLKRIQAAGFKYMAFLQDDTFCMVGREEIDHLLSYVETNDFNMLNIEIKNVNTEKDVLFEKSNLVVYNTDSVDFSKTMWSMDDGPFIANVDFLLGKVYDANFFLLNDVWSAESYTNDKIKRNPIQRLSTNTVFFVRVNIVGKHAFMRDEHIPLLTRVLGDA
jgi:hypothetical protein